MPAMGSTTFRDSDSIMANTRGSSWRLGATCCAMFAHLVFTTLKLKADPTQHEPLKMTG